LPRNSLKAGSALLALYISMALLVVGMTSEVFVPLFLQVLHQQTPLLAGYIAALMAAGWTLGAIFSSGLGPRGAARAIAIGPFLVVAGLLLACLFMPATATPALSLGAVCLAMLLVGVGIGLAWPHLLSRVLEQAPQDQKELAGASITTVQLVATALGAPPAQARLHGSIRPARPGDSRAGRYSPGAGPRGCRCAPRSRARRQR